MGRIQSFGVASSERVLYTAHPAMFKCEPVKFVAFLFMVPFLGLGVLLLFLWWFDCLGTTLTVTDRRTILRRGVFSKFTNDVLHQDVRNVQVLQTFFMRIFGIGNLGISSSAQSGVEIEVSGIPYPESVRELIYQCRAGNVPPTPLPSNNSQPRSVPTQPNLQDVEEVDLPQPTARKDSYFASEEFKAKAQGVLDSLTYAASFKWVSGLPDWAQPLVWGILMGLPVALMLIIAVSAFS